ncbi:MAG: biotin transporter BioY [Elainellaceae cyanobacterium]
MFSPIDLLWALIGLLLTIGGTFLEASMAGVPLNWFNPSIPVLSLRVTWQVGAVLLIGSLGGRNAAAISQIAYLLLGLTWFNVFTNGGGPGYVFHPTFGYLLGFVPAAWICGWLAFQLPRRLESIAFSNLCGLFTIHAAGLSYLAIAHAVNWSGTGLGSLLRMVIHYSLIPLPGQLVLVCAVAVIAFFLRHLLLY